MPGEPSFTRGTGAKPANGISMFEAAVCRLGNLSHEGIGNSNTEFNKIYTPIVSRYLFRDNMSDLFGIGLTSDAQRQHGDLWIVSEKVAGSFVGKLEGWVVRSYINGDIWSVSGLRNMVASLLATVYLVLILAAQLREKGCMGPRHCERKKQRNALCSRSLAACTGFPFTKRREKRKESKQPLMPDLYPQERGNG
eukprot:960409-Pelagomonas_calceolata.AAC.4